LKGLPQADTKEDLSELRRAEGTRRPLGTPEFDADLESLL
jgi:hypothetical protein